MENKEKKPFEIFSREELREVRGGDGTYYGVGGPGTCFEIYNNNGYTQDVQTSKRCFETHDCIGYHPGSSSQYGTFTGWNCRIIS